MELDEPQALVHLLWLGASVDKKIADSEREYIQKVCSHEKIPLELEELQKHHENNQFDKISVSYTHLTLPTTPYV